MTEKLWSLPVNGITYPPQRRARRIQFIRALREAGRPAQRVMEWFLGFGDFAPPEGQEYHPDFIQNGVSDFIDSVRRGYLEYGTVTEKQFAVITRMYTDLMGTLDALETMRTEADIANGVRPDAYLADVGSRVRTKLTVIAAHQRQGNPQKRHPPSAINIMTDPKDRQVVWFSGTLLSPGDQFEAFVTVGAQQVHKGTPQTVAHHMKIIQKRTPRRIRL